MPDQSADYVAVQTAVERAFGEARTRYGKRWAKRRLRLISQQPCVREALAELAYDGFCSHCWASALIDGGRDAEDVG